jgi:hypothetical protein
MGAGVSSEAGPPPAANAEGSVPAAFGLGEVTPISGGNSRAQERALDSGISLVPSSTKPHWACPQSSCEAIVDPAPRRVAGRWVLPDGAQALEGSGENGGYSAADLQSAYGITTSGGEAQQHYEEGQTIALVDAGYLYSAESNNAEYRKRYGLPRCTKASGCFRQVNEWGEEHNPQGRIEEWALETTLDIDMASAMCPHCHILLVEATTQNEGNLAAAASTAARLGATEISNSYGIPEEVSLLDVDYSHPGVVVTAAAGDCGYDNYRCSVPMRPSWPAVLPSVIAVGGTALHRTTDGRKWSESVWSEGGRGETGSGCSRYRSKPSWQTDSGCAQRTVNDVAAVAACETPVSIYLPPRGWQNVCGTSVSAPLVAGIEARANEHGGAVPTADAFFEDRGALYDVTIGHNDTSCTPEYLCNAEKPEGGYNGPAGNGTPQAGAVVAAGEAPAARTEPPTAGPTMNGVVDPNGLPTTYCFEYSSNPPPYGPCVPVGEASAGAGTAAMKVSQTVAGLEPRVYYYRLSATNADGTTRTEPQVLDVNPPSVTAVSPASGYQPGATHVKIMGSEFRGVAAVRFGSTQAPTFSVPNEREIEAVSPLGSGTVDVTVETGGGSSATSAADRFTYNVLPPPSVTGIGPSVGPTSGQTRVTILGSSFANVTAVKFGTTEAAAFKVRSEGEIRALSPAGAGTADITVTTAAGTSATGSADQFSYEAVEAPTGATAGWLAPLNVSSLAASFGVSEVAMDEHGDTVAVWPTEAVVQSAFRPAGGSWEAPVALSTEAKPLSNPRLALDPNGDGLATWPIFTASSQTVQAAVRSADGTWQAPVDLSTGCRNVNNYVEPHVALDAAGDALVGWRCQFTEGPGRVAAFTDFKPAGGNWQAPVVLSETLHTEAEAPSAPGLIFDSQGNAYAYWHEQGLDKVAYRPAGGNWQAATAIGEGELQLGVDGHDNAYALVSAHGGLAVAYRPAGGSWQPPALVVSAGLQEEAGPSEPDFVVDAAGEEALIWGASEGGNGNIEVARKPPGGRWQAPVILTTAANQGPEPTMAFDASGDAIAAFRIAGGLIDAARLPAGGRWQETTLISGSATSGAGGPEVATTPRGNAVVAWGHEGVIQAAGFDAGPQLEALSIPTSATVGQPLSFSVSPLGVWSTLKETKWTFGDGASASGTSVSHTYSAPGSHEVTVESEDALGQATRETRTITISPPVTITHIGPSSGSNAGGTSVTITGTGFKEVSAVRFGSTPATSFKVGSETSIMAVAPPVSPSTGPLDITVTTAGGTSATGSADQFTYTMPLAAGDPVFYSGSLRLSGARIGVISLGPIKFASAALGAEWECVGLGFGNVGNEGSPPIGTGQILSFSAQGDISALGTEARRSCKFKKAGLEGEPEAWITDEPTLETTRKTPLSVPWNLQLVCVENEGAQLPLVKIGIPNGLPASSGCHNEAEAAAAQAKEEEERKGCYATSVPEGCVKLDMLAPALGLEAVFEGSVLPKVLDGFSTGLRPSSLEYTGGLAKLHLHGGFANTALASGTSKLVGFGGMQLIWAR